MKIYCKDIKIIIYFVGIDKLPFCRSTIHPVHRRIESKMSFF